jgi:hypothetical protein
MKPQPPSFRIHVNTHCIHLFIYFFPYFYSSLPSPPHDCPLPPLKTTRYPSHNFPSRPQKNRFPSMIASPQISTSNVFLIVHPRYS